MTEAEVSRSKIIRQNLSLYLFFFEIMRTPSLCKTFFAEKRRPPKKKRPKVAGRSELTPSLTGCLPFLGFRIYNHKKSKSSASLCKPGLGRQEEQNVKMTNFSPNKKVPDGVGSANLLPRIKKLCRPYRASRGHQKTVLVGSTRPIGLSATTTSQP